MIGVAPLHNDGSGLLFPTSATVERDNY